MLLAVLEVIAPQFKHFGKLREFINMKLPPGFPIQVSLSRDPYSEVETNKCFENQA